MKKLKIIGAVYILILLLISAITIWGENVPEQISNEEKTCTNSPPPASEDPYTITAKRDLLALMMAYPGYIKGLEKGKDGIIYVILKSGNKIVYDDKKTKNYEEKLADADLEDMLELVYPLCDINHIMGEDFDPGRIRAYAFFKEIYGKTQGEVEANLTRIGLGSGSFSFNRNNDAARALETAFKDISGLIQNKPEIYGFVYPLSGTFNYRVIAGTNQLSPHAFGIAIDLKSDRRDYWRWATREQGQDRLDSYPKDLVRALEAHGFIWGGKWAHFDILHYEYRPELIIKSKYYIDPDEITGPWYSGFPDTGSVRSCISIIDHAF